MNNLQPFLVGVNYWPRRKAMYWWTDFDLGEVRDEFATIKAMGITLVRIFLLWEDWQETPDSVNSQAVADLGAVCDVAAELRLSLDVTFFVGHMSGPSWTPQWLLQVDQRMLPGVRQVVSGRRVVNCGYRNPYTDPVALQAAELLLRTVISRYRDHPAIGLWNLGNEPDLFAKPTSGAVGRQWVRRLAAIAHEIDPGHPVTCGLHMASLTEDNGLRVHEIFEEVDVPAMHAYPMYADWARGPLDSDFVPFACALTSALCGGKPVLMEEFGGCTVPPGRASCFWEWTAYGQDRRQFMASEDELAAYTEQVLTKLVDVGAVGAVWWCYADYVPALFDRPPCDESRHERSFGLVRPDGSWKPQATVLQRFAATQPKVLPPARWLALDLLPEVYYQDPLTHVQRLYQAFVSGK